MTEACRCGVEFCIEDEPEILFEIDDDGVIDLEVGDPVILSDVFPDYEGEYRFTPGPETQILETRNRVLRERIVIDPIPRNYGLITYNGRTITVS